MILITRHKNDSKSLVGELAKKKLKSYIYPISNFTFSKKKIKDSNYIYVIASPRAVLFLKKNNLTDLKKRTFIVIGKKTLEQLINYGYKNILFSANTSDDLIKKINQKKIQNKKLRYLCSNIYNRNFIYILRSRGYRIRVTRIYKTVPIQKFSTSLQSKIKNQKLEAAIFYSRFSLENFLKLCRTHKISQKKLKRIKFYCLSKRIAEPAIKLSLDVLHPRTPSELQLIKMIKNKKLGQANFPKKPIKVT